MKTLVLTHEDLGKSKKEIVEMIDGHVKNKQGGNMEILNQPVQKEVRVKARSLDPEMRTVYFPVTVGAPGFCLGYMPSHERLPVLKYRYDRTEVIHIYTLADIRT